MNDTVTTGPMLDAALKMVSVAGALDSLDIDAAELSWRWWGVPALSVQVRNVEDFRVLIAEWGLTLDRRFGAEPVMAAYRGMTHAEVAIEVFGRDPYPIQLREHDVPCQSCHRPTWSVDAICDACRAMAL